MVIGTERLILRGWRESDLGPWAAMNADPEVSEAPLRRHVVYRKRQDQR
jgi:RimJ/RimL family protein N-acetyltransferase